ncbi:MAG TPA: hypothetical protein VJH92_05380 [Candidatus Nanoarchaeia archaeon]|nr:hypothetical protein [Candidatus Nanoarchaeia archaeon]
MALEKTKIIGNAAGKMIFSYACDWANELDHMDPSRRGYHSESDRHAQSRFKILTAARKGIVSNSYNLYQNSLEGELNSDPSVGIRAINAAGKTLSVLLPLVAVLYMVSLNR